MDFDLSEEQQALLDVARDLFQSHAGVETARALLDDSSHPRPNRVEELRDMGFLGMIADPAVGGSGGTLLDLAVIAEQAGANLSTAPLVGTAAFATALLASLGAPEAAALLAPALQDGRRVGVAHVPALDLSDAGRVSGTTSPCLDGIDADVIVALATGGDGQAVVAIDATEGKPVVQRPMDATRGLVKFTFTDADATVLADGDRAKAAWDHATHVATVVLAAELLGVVGECVRRGVAYALEREAFGRRIGGFQAVKHMLVDAYVLEEQLRSLVWVAAWAYNSQPASFSLYAAAAAAYASDAASKATDILIQVHGGIGFTWEHDAHLYWRRARVDRELFGRASDHRAHVAHEVLETA